MKKYMQIALSTGHVYEIPTEVIAKNRAEYYARERPVEFPDLAAALADTVGLFDDSTEIREWALNNMNPDEYMPSARLVRFVPPNPDFDSAEWSYHDNRTPAAVVDGDDVLEQPLEALLSSLADARQNCNVTVLNDDNGNPYAMLAVILGGQEAIGAFTGALQFTSDLIEKKASISPAIIN